jgi:3-mercaptopyruvate sulfurtransferase SseA
MQRTKSTLFVLLTFAFFLSACSAQPTQTQPTSVPTTVIEPAVTQPSGDLPQTEAEVPRVSIEEAKAAFDSGAAIIVDVRSPSAFEASHIAGAISVPLGQIERDLTNVPLNKDQWIITYCT